MTTRLRIFYLRFLQLVFNVKLWLSGTGHIKYWQLSNVSILTLWMAMAMFAEMLVNCPYSKWLKPEARVLQS
jgi:hypothetical protein